MSSDVCNNEPGADRRRATRHRKCALFHIPTRLRFGFLVWSMHAACMGGKILAPPANRRPAQISATCIVESSSKTCRLGSKENLERRHILGLLAGVAVQRRLGRLAPSCQDCQYRFEQLLPKLRLFLYGPIVQKSLAVSGAGNDHFWENQCHHGLFCTSPGNGARLLLLLLLLLCICSLSLFWLQLPWG